MLCANSRMTAAALQATEKRIKDETKPELLRCRAILIWEEKKKKNCRSPSTPVTAD